MAREAHRRRGFSRRIQYTLFAGYVVAGVSVLLGLALIVLQRINPQAFGAVTGVMLDATAPLADAGHGIVRGVNGVEADVSAYIDAGGQNQALRRELAAVRGEVLRARAIQYENLRLKRLARLAADQPPPVAVAAIFGSSAASQRRFATLMAGSNAGVGAGMPVRSPDGLIGLVGDVGRTAARVMLITDGASTVPVRIARSGQPALAAGRGDGTLDVKTVIGAGAAFRIGDLIVTSGTGGVYAPGVPVALILSVDGDIAIARPLADPAKLDFAVVEPVYGPALPAPAAPPPRGR